MSPACALSSALPPPAAGLAAARASPPSTSKHTMGGRPSPSSFGGPSLRRQEQPRLTACAALPAFDPTPLFTLADAAPGDVVAPNGALIGGALICTVAITALVPLILAPGDDAAKEYQKADKKFGRRGRD